MPFCKEAVPFRNRRERRREREREDERQSPDATVHTRACASTYRANAQKYVRTYVPPYVRAATSTSSRLAANGLGWASWAAGTKTVLAGRGGRPGLPRRASPKTVLAGRAGLPWDLATPRRRVGPPGDLATLRRSQSWLGGLGDRGGLAKPRRRRSGWCWAGHVRTYVRRPPERPRQTSAKCGKAAPAVPYMISDVMSKKGA